MGKQGKNSAKRKKADQKSKKKKIGKKIGLAKYIQPLDAKPKKPSRVDQHEADKLDHTKPVMAKKQISCPKKSDQKNLSLVDRCKLQMSSSLLRLIDEDLYTSDTKNVDLDKEKFLAYHDAYAAVCEKWPTKPIDHIVKFIKKRLLSKKFIDKLKFADIGCGKQPLLKMKLSPKANVKSFDLVSSHPDIIEANMEKLPLEDESIHCAVYSLSLMAKNLGNIILECKRILKLNGSMVIVEVTSRFEGREKRFTHKMDKLGFKQQSIAQLKPNGYFTFFHFTKTDCRMDYGESTKNIELKPCIYKAR